MKSSAALKTSEYNILKKHKYLILTIIWMIVIFLFSSQNGNVSNMNNMYILDLLKKAGISLEYIVSYKTANFIIRKVAHFCEYFILGVLLIKTYDCYNFKRSETLSIVTGFLYSCSDETHQYFVPGRGPSFRDVLIDTSGVLAGIIIILLIYKRKLKA